MAQNDRNNNSRSTMQYWSDMEQEGYDPEEFVERLAFRARGGGAAADLSDAQQLHQVINDHNS